MTALEARFWVALRKLEHWHSDALKAQDFSGPQTSPTKPGSTILQRTPYPHFSYWTNEWRKARNDEEREEVIRGLDEEWFELGVSPSLKHAHLVRGTLEWKTAIATQDAPAKIVARWFGIGLSTVYKYRGQYGSTTA